MTMQHLFVSLGHNSSAAFSTNGKIIRAYEQERLDRKKSSSAYPRDAIELAIGDAGYSDVTYVSHWFNNFELQTNKYLDLAHLKLFSNNVVGLSHELTHHDAHARSVCSFYVTKYSLENSYVVVSDGFGSMQECFSFYQLKARCDVPKLIHRTYGYSLSLGLMYQYVTEYLGMKPNQDEYKLLGYERHILRYTTVMQSAIIRQAVERQASAHAQRMLSKSSSTIPPWTNGLIDFESLKKAKTKWFRVAETWRNYFPEVTDPAGIKTCVAYCAQTFIESATEALIKALAGNDPRALLLAGGCFYNVKLNRRLALATKGKTVRAHPLSGDQGAAMGIGGDDISTLLLGERDLTSDSTDGFPVGMHSISHDNSYKVIADAVCDGAIVNVVRGEMEFGPRALCNTTTFALPTKEKVALINSLNDRDDSMPMAPVMTKAAAEYLLKMDELVRADNSAQYMITTCAFVNVPPSRLLGVAHRDPIADIWTARPQVTDDWWLCNLLSMTPDQVLINTSFNYHGEPIVYSVDDARRTHQMQCFKAKTLGIAEPITFVIEDR